MIPRKKYHPRKVVPRTEDKYLKSKLEVALFRNLTKFCPTPFKTQFLFHPTRQWRFDFAFVKIKLAVEVQGYGAGHAAYMSMSNDYSKHNEAIRLHWSILYFMSHDLDDRRMVKTLRYINETIELLQSKRI